MSRGLRILHLADSHIGAQLPARPRDASAWRRGDDFIASYRRVLARARELDVDLLLHAGDLFDEPAPSHAAIAAAATPLLELAAAGFPVVIVPGNHERSAIPGSLLFQHPNLHVLAAPGSVRLALRGLRVTIAGAPCVRHRSAVRFSASIDASNWEAARGDVNVLLAHQTFESAVCGAANFRFRSGEDVVERSAVPAGFHYVAAGHVHRHQTLASLAAPIVYSGSVDRISFAEEHEAKGCVLIEESGGALTHRFLEHPVRPMAKLPLDVSGRCRQAIRDEVLRWAQGLPCEALAQVRLSGRTAARELRGIALTAQVAAIRPDLRIAVSSQAVEFASERAIHGALPVSSTDDMPRGSVASAFDALCEQSAERVSKTVDRVRELPTGFGVYALYDTDDRLLYVGKATNVRSRVRQHLAARPSGAFFEGWTRAIARIEARPAYSELEALLVEADLIRALRPPFNRQMRQWDRYCYLCEGARPHGELTIVRDIPPEDARVGTRLFGPYRTRHEAALVAQAVAGHLALAYCRPLVNFPSRGRVGKRAAATLPAVLNLCERYFNGACAGPCGGRAAESAYESAREQRARLLQGEDDSTFAAVERELTERVESSEDDPTPEVKAALELYQTLRHAFEHGRLLREAAILMGATLRLAGPGGGTREFQFGVDGLRAADGAAREADPQVKFEPAASGGRLVPKAMLDALCMAARYLRRETAPAEDQA
jgi:predicted GIY-YIG superfamily endonuclease